MADVTSDQPAAYWWQVVGGRGQPASPGAPEKVVFTQSLTRSSKIKQYANERDLYKPALPPRAAFCVLV